MLYHLSGRKADFAQHDILKNDVWLYFFLMCVSHKQEWDPGNRLPDPRRFHWTQNGNDSISADAGRSLQGRPSARGFDQIQPLDLGPCAIHKMESHRIYAHGDFNLQTRKLLEMLYG
jgi:hypothetical protein